MKKTQIKSNLEIMWKRQVDVLAHRRPSWILLMSGGTIVLAAIKVFAYSAGNDLPPLFIHNQKYFAMGMAYVAMTIGLYGWLLARDREKIYGKKSWKKIWLYNAFDMISLSLMSLIALDGSLQIFMSTGLSFSIVQITHTGILASYLLFVVLSGFFMVRRLSNDLDLNNGLTTVKLAFAMSIFTMAGSSTMGIFFSANDVRIGLIALAGLLLTFSLVLTSLWSAGMINLILLLWYRIPEKREVFITDSSREENVDNYERLIREIHSWLEPQEDLQGFTIGYYGNFSSQMQVVLALTSKYMRIGAVEGGRNIPLQEIEKIEWSPVRARIRISTIPSKQTLQFAIFGRKWKESAKMLAEAWRHSR